jgi:glucosamine-6-phosphate deaminase
MSAAGPSVQLEVLAAPDWASAVAGRLAERIRAAPDIRLCLPTGQTPTPVYAALAEAERAGDCPMDRATIVLLDEWVGLDPGDPARCDTRLRAELLDRLAAPPAFVPIDVDDPDPDAAAARHDVAARGIGLVLLGLGMNGHVGFNEPGSRPDDTTRLVRLAVSSREAAMARYGAARTPTAGITTGMARLLEADEVWLLVTGERKAPILRRALREPEGVDCPASFLRRHPRFTVFADEAAASLL